MNETADVLVSVTIVRPEERLLLRALRATGLTARSVTPRHTAAILNGAVPRPRAVLLRNVSHRELAAMSDRFEQAGIETLNTPGAVRLCLSKDLQAIAFARSGVPHPTTHVAFSVEQVGEYVAALGGDAVLKPISGSWGRGVVRVSDDAQLDAWAGGREGLDPRGTNFPVVVQQYVPKPGYNLRVHVVGHRPVVAYRQISPGLCTNTHQGGLVEPVPVTDRARELCDRVVDCFGPGFYGIDLVESVETGEMWVLEVNTNPDFARSSEIHGVDIPGHVAEYVRDRVFATIPSGVA
ncbi:RimK family alpha-L-glutamate ligase [Micromonospora sp. WMMD1102]|uniref:ATP-grasp domain-containing protein n=1 Tax=Micromonospora sp. WMMD1102 TaxID=3016105 RepID=UPI002414EFD3|nr:RimK family alpha-L-glutamate ligase [Micromonospora sp. WMMD1102]MDG4785116.1 RimK family alpha-L-glutamate ligase [Micromonospora sp. WMMD1102]